MADLDLSTVEPDIEIIPSIQLGFDPVTGMPRTEPAEEPKPKPVKAEPDPEITSLRQKLAEGDRERERIAQEATEARAAREAEKTRADKAEKDRDTNSTYAIRAHRDAVTARYQEAYQAQSEIETGLQAAQTIKASLEEAKRRVITDDNLDPHERARQQVKIDSDIAALAARMETLEAGKRGVESRVAEARQTYEETERRLASLRERPEPEAQEERVPQPPKNADEFISAAPAQLKGWLAEHREFADPNSDENVDLQGFAAKWLRKNGGNHAALNSEAFREALDGKFFPKQSKQEEAEVAEPEVKEEAKTATRQATPSAPVSRSGTPSNPGKSGAIKLTPEQYAMAPELITDFADLDADFQAKFKAWSPTAARYQYERNLQRALKEKPHRFSS